MFEEEMMYEEILTDAPGLEVSRARLHILPPPVWGSRAHFETFWDNRHDDVVCVHGTAQQAILTLDECKEVFPKIPLVRSSRAEEPFCSLIDWLRDGFVVMHPEEVVGFDDACAVDGVSSSEQYTIFISESSQLKKEVIQSHDQKLFVLRYSGVLVSAYMSIKVHVDSRERVSLA